QVDQLDPAVDTHDEPGPTAPEAPGRSRLELVAEGAEIAERGADRFADRAARLTASIGPHDLPEERVVGVATPVVPHRRADLLRQAVDVAQDLLDRLPLRLRVLGD